MDCKSPIFMLADLSARKQAEAAMLAADPMAPPNFDEPTDSPNPGYSRKGFSDSPFVGIPRRFAENFAGSPPMSSAFGKFASSPPVRADARQAQAQSPPMTNHSDSGESSPSIGNPSQFADLGDIKASPRIDVLMQAAECSDKQKKKRLPPNPEKKSKFRGVSWQKTSRAWVAQFKTNGKTTYLGLFATEEDAAKAYDVAVYTNTLGSSHQPRLNFGKPDQETIDAYLANGHVPPGRLGATATRQERNPEDGEKDKHTTSNYRGVSWYAARQIWKASIQVNRKKEYIGRFETEEEAARAYNRRAQELRGKDAILNQVPNTSTRYPPGEIPLPPEQLERDAIAAKERKKASKRKSSANDGDSSSPDDSAAAAANDAPNKKSKKTKVEGRAQKHLNSQLAFSTMLSTPDLSIFTPMLLRSADGATSRKRLHPLPKPSFANVDDEMERALKNVGNGEVFDSPLFTSPMPTTNLKRRKGDQSALAGAMTAGAPPFTVSNLNTTFTPMLQNLFDSPYPQFDSTAFTPSDLAPYKFDLSTTRKGRKVLASRS